jgi:hypothetical protein
MKTLREKQPDLWNGIMKIIARLENPAVEPISC